MKLKLILFSLLSIASCAVQAYVYRVNNNTAGQVYVELNAIGTWSNPNQVIEPGRTWEINTRGYCVNRVTAIGRSGVVQGLTTSLNVQGIACRGRTFNIRSMGEIRDVRERVDENGRPLYVPQTLRIEDSN
ncbi:hypothetical protein Noda2021_11700 [Candidatus Dependentiae bacterium Noda2021]|nr:hypothetical protein Noda2021_11700 [Candidatus Dependentiae bacterium Noda2021]